MTAAIFLFWDIAVGSPAPPAPAPPAPTPETHPILPGAGVSRVQVAPKTGTLPINGKQVAYVPMTREDWDVREAYLRSLYPPEIPPAPPPDTSVLDYTAEANRLYEQRQQQLEQLNSQRVAAVEALRSAEDIQTIREQGAVITDINAKINEITGQQAVTRFMH